MKRLDSKSGSLRDLRAIGGALVCSVLVALCAAGTVFAQDKEKVVESLTPITDQQQELIQLFGKVETRLREIDRLLSDAGAGDTKALESVGPAGIDELLKRSKASGEEAVQDIDKILELAKQMGQQQQPSSGGGQGPQQQPQSGGQGGESPLDGQSGNTTKRESTPSTPEAGGQKPEEKPGGSKPDGQKNEGNSKKDGEKPKGEGSPKDPSASKSDPRNRESGPPPGGGREGSSATSDTRDRWGDLPVHARDVFRNEGGRDMPVQYRDWIDGYYRRLNKKVP